MKLNLPTAAQTAPLIALLSAACVPQSAYGAPTTCCSLKAATSLAQRAGGPRPIRPAAAESAGRQSRRSGGALADVGIGDNFIKEAAQTLQSGNAALFLLIRKMTTDKVLAALQGAGGTVMRTSFDHTKEEALSQALAAHVAANPAA